MISSLSLNSSVKNLNDNKIDLPPILSPQSDSDHLESNFVVENVAALKESCWKPSLTVLRKKFRFFRVIENRLPKTDGSFLQ